MQRRSGRRGICRISARQRKIRGSDSERRGKGFWNKIQDDSLEIHKIVKIKKYHSAVIRGR